MKPTLSKKISLLIICIALCLSSVLIAFSYNYYQNTIFAHYETVATNIARIAAAQINKDRIQYYLDTLHKDEEYMETYERLCEIRENGGIMYLYVTKPELEEVYYVLDTDPSGNAIPLGFHEPYYEGAFAENAKKLARGEYTEPIISNEEFGWLMSINYPMFDSEGNPAGCMCVDISMNDIMNDLENFRIQMILILVAITAIFSAFFIWITIRTVVRPVKQLSGAAERLVKEEADHPEMEKSVFANLKVNTKDEIEDLYHSLVSMEDNINYYIANLMSITAEKERIGAELNVATQIQADMLPNIFPAFPGHDEFDIYATMQPAKEVGGDFYDFFMVDNDHLAIVMADVSGKGVPAALFMVIAKTLIKNHTQGKETPAEVFTNVNEQLCENNEVGMFVTGWMGVVDIHTGHMVYVNAGHNYPLIIKKDGTVEWVRSKPGLVFGGMEGIRYRQNELVLKDGECIYLYTDGVTEALDAAWELFGDERLVQTLSRPEAKDLTPELLLPFVNEDLLTFTKGVEQSDDITMLALQMNLVPENKKEEAQDWKELICPARREELAYVIEFVEKQMEAADFKMGEAMQVSLAVEEIFVNIASYAYEGGEGEAVIRVHTDKPEKQINIRFEDSGKPYNPLERKDPDITLSAEERGIGGLGIYMVKKSMDDIYYEYKDGKNCLTISRKSS